MEGTVRRLIPLGFALLLGACAPTWGEQPAPVPPPVAVAYTPPPPAPYVAPSYGRPYLPPADVVVRPHHARYHRHYRHHYHHRGYVQARAVHHHRRSMTNSGGLPKATAQ